MKASKILLFLAVFLALPLRLSAQELYALYYNNSLTFYYDNLRGSRDGRAYLVSDNYIGSNSTTFTTAPDPAGIQLVQKNDSYGRNSIRQGVFDLRGTKIAETLDEIQNRLPWGVYIVNGR